MSRVKPTQQRAWRFPVVLLVPALVIAGVVVQQRIAPRSISETEVTDPAQLMPVVQRAGVASTTFFCAGGTATGRSDGFAEHTVSVSNQSGDRRTGKVTVYFDKAEPLVRPIEVGARSRLDTVLSDVGKSEFASAVVEITGGEIAVEHSVAGPAGRSVSACASSPSNHWYFPAGSTRPGARLVLSVFNPFPDDAVVDITFETDDGDRQPQAFNPLVVPASRVVGVDVTGVVTLRRQIATTVITRAGSGRVVVDQLQSFDGKDLTAPGVSLGNSTGTTRLGPTASASGTTTYRSGDGVTGPAERPLTDNRLKGLSVTLGAPAPVSTWLFPEGPPLTDGVDQHYVVMNPGSDPVVAEVQIRQDDHRVTGMIEPYEVNIRPGQYAMVSLTQDDRVPRGVGHWATVSSSGGPVVAGRLVTAVGEAPNKGFSVTLGSPLMSTRWLIAAADSEKASGAVISIVNPSAESAEVTVTEVAAGRDLPVEGFAPITLGPGERAVAPAGRRTAGSQVSVAVAATVPVVVEHRIAFDTTSFASALGEPVVGTLTVATSGPPSEADADVIPPASSPLLDPGHSGTTAPYGSVPPGTLVLPELPGGTTPVAPAVEGPTATSSPPTSSPPTSSPPTSSET